MNDVPTPADRHPKTDASSLTSISRPSCDDVLRELMMKSKRPLAVGVSIRACLLAIVVGLVSGGTSTGGIGRG